MPDLKIAGSATLSLRDFYAAAYRRWPAGARWAYVISFVIIVAYNLWIDDVEDIDTLYESGVALPVVMLFICVVIWFAGIALLFARMSPKQKQMNYEIDGERIVVHDATGSTVIRPWTEVKACREFKTGFAIRMKPLGSYWLVKRAFAPTDLEALRAMTKSILGTGR